MNSTGINLPFMLIIFMFYSGFANAADAQQYYNFTIPWDDNYNNVISAMNAIDDKPAGTHGVLKTSADQLIFEDGTAAEFWGVAITVSKKFPPKNKIDTKKIINKLKKYGFNLVRINGLDFPRYNLYHSWLKTGKLDKDIMDRLDYFIAELKKSGIYYSLSINNSSLKAKEIYKVSSNGHKIRHKQYKFVQLYDEKVIERVIDWHKVFYGHINEYTKVSYAKDSANIFVTAIGEDSIFNGYFNYHNEFLTDKNFTDLQLKFNDFLRSKYKTSENVSVAWEGDLKPVESLEKNNIKLVTANNIAKVNKHKSNDVILFLSDIDRSYANRIRDVLKGVGYLGLFAGTNDWYGYSSLKINQDIGDFIDMHGYFDPMIRNRHNGKRIEYTRNTSYISGPAALSQGNEVVEEFDKSLYTFFASAVENKPLMITEWNHSAWSDYTYEGPLLLTAYSSLQGYNSMVIHSYFSMKLNYDAEYSDNSLVASGNPVLMSLSPTLSLAFRNSYISESPSFSPVMIAANNEQLNDAMIRDRLNKLNRRNGLPYNYGFMKKIRMRLVGAKDNSASSLKFPDNQWLSDTGQISWNFANHNRSYFSVNTKKFQLLAGQLSNVNANLDNIKVSLTDHGAVTAISLDDVELGKSSSILVTAVSSFKNTGMVTGKVPKYRKWQKLKSIINSGVTPIMMKRVQGHFELETSNNKRVVVSGVNLDGTYDNIKVDNHLIAENKHVVSFNLGSVDTPWYWIKFVDK